MKLELAGVRLPLAHFDLAVTVQLSQRVTGIFGPSGAGKTSLLEIVAGLRPRMTGRVLLDGVVFDDSASGIRVEARHRRIGYVPQENALFPHMSVLGNIQYGARGSSVNHVVEVLELGPLLRRDVKTLSGGEQKRVALARALVISPRLLLLDEPLAGLDRPLHERILRFLQRIRDDFGVPMLYVTHDLSELGAIAEEIVMLDRGAIAVPGP